MRGTEMPLPTIWLVRHGETRWTITGQHTGRSDIPLTAAGVEQARRLRERLQTVPFAAVFTSPLSRARDTSVYAGFGARSQIDADLAEWDYGAYEGRRTSEIRLERPAWRLFEDGCPGGETADSVGVRADRVIARVREHAGHAVLFAHRDLLRVFVARWLGLPPMEGRRFHLETASVSVVGYEHALDEPVIRLWNDSAARDLARRM